MLAEKTAHLSDGTHIFYTDSGPVAGSDDYTTLIVLHGSAYPGRGMEVLHNFAAPHNLRIIIPERKGYPGSSPHTEKELEELRNGSLHYIESLGTYLANFLQHIVTENQIPKASEDGTKGGIAVLGWSMGTVTAMALFLGPEVISQSTYDVLQPYIKDLVLYDPPHISLGYIQPENSLYNPFTHPAFKSAEEVFDNFKPWVASYHEVPEGWSGDINALQSHKRGDRVSTDVWTQKEWDVNFNFDAAVGIEYWMNHPGIQPSLYKVSSAVLFGESRVNFPKAKVTYAYASHSVWCCVWGRFETERIYDEKVKSGEEVRPMKFLRMEGTNHFAHVDYPDKLIETVDNGIGRKL